MTEKQKLFCLEYLKDCNATQAAIRAGYSRKTAGQIGEENLKKPEIRRYIDEQLNSIKSKAIADVEEIQEYLTAVLRGKSETEQVVIEWKGIGLTEARTITKTPEEKERLKAAELLGKAFGMYTDKLTFKEEPVFINDDLKE